MKRIMLFASALALAACTNSESSKPIEGHIPEKLEDRPVIIRTPLTSAEMRTIKNLNAKVSKMPEATLFLPAADEYSSKKAERLEKISKLEQDGKLIYDRIQNNCQFGFPQKTGSEEFSTVTSSINGNNCPIHFTEQNQSQVTKQPDGKKYIVKVASLSNLQILDPSMQNLVGHTKSRINFSANGVFAYPEEDPSSYTTYMSGSGGITLQTLNGQNAAMNASFEMLRRGEKFSAYMEVNYTLGSISATVQVYSDEDRDSKNSKFFLNGQPITETELKDTFGDNFHMEMGRN